jgi:hypothetical protein
MQGRVARPLAWGDPAEWLGASDQACVTRRPAGGSSPRRGRASGGARPPSADPPGSGLNHPTAGLILRTQCRRIHRPGPPTRVYLRPGTRLTVPEGPVATGPSRLAARRRGSGGVAGRVQVRAASWTPSTSTGRSPLGTTSHGSGLHPLGRARGRHAGTTLHVETSGPWTRVKDMRREVERPAARAAGGALPRSSARRGAGTFGTYLPLPVHVGCHYRCAPLSRLTQPGGALDVSRSLAPSHGGLRRGAVLPPVVPLTGPGAVAPAHTAHGGPCGCTLSTAGLPGQHPKPLVSLANRTTALDLGSRSLGLTKRISVHAGTCASLVTGDPALTPQAVRLAGPPVPAGRTYRPLETPGLQRALSRASPASARADERTATRPALGGAGCAVQPRWTKGALGRAPTGHRPTRNLWVSSMPTRHGAAVGALVPLATPCSAGHRVTRGPRHPPE